MSIVDMSDFKLRKGEVLKFINLYKSYECLWNFKSPLYKRVDYKKKAWYALSVEFQTSVENVKKKAKALRSVYVQEKKKVDASKKSGASIDDSYVPNLFYYDEMKFLDDAIVLRKSTDYAPKNENNTIDDPDLLEETGFSTERYATSSGENFEYTEYPSRDYDDEDPLAAKTYTREPPTPEPRKKKSRLTQLSSIVNNMKEIKNDFTKLEREDDEFDLFGRYIAIQLRKLSAEQAILGQEEIQKVVTKCRLNDLKYRNTRYSHIVQESGPGSNRFSRSPASTADTQATQNTPILL